VSKVCRIVSLSYDQVAMLHGKPFLAADVARVAQHEEMAAAIQHAMARMPISDRMAFTARRQPEEAKIAISRRRLASFGLLERPLNLGTSWHILHFVLSGRARPASRKPWHHFISRRSLPVYDPADSLMNGEKVGEDLGHGPARLQDSARTEAFARFLAEQNVDDLLERVHFRKMTWLGIHGLPFGPRESSDFAGEVRAEVAAYFPLLRDRVAWARAQRGGLLIWLS
jgi:hypothetical protein